MRALVTGGAGFIGSNLTNRLIETGWDVEVIDNLSNGHVSFLHDESVLTVGDFTDPIVLDKIDSGRYDYVFHLAAIPRVSYSVQHPLETNETNVSKTLALMTACRNNVRRFIFASSSSVYGGADVLPTKESYVKSPKSPYALQKSIIEDYLKVYYLLYKLDSVCLRFFNVFGPNQLGGSPYSTAVSSWLTSIKKGVPMRSDGDGTQSRDMCYVDNVVDALLLSAKFDGNLEAECFNVACGDRTTNKQVLECLKTNYPFAESYDAPWRPGDVMHTQADLTKINTVLGYVPRVKFWAGLTKTIQWYEENWDTIKEMC